jgi:hypothetical protein
MVLLLKSTCQDTHLLYGRSVSCLQLEIATRQVLLFALQLVESDRLLSRVRLLCCQLSFDNLPDALLVRQGKPQIAEPVLERLAQFTIAEWFGHCLLGRLALSK